MSKPRIILFDLETLPNLNEALKVWPQLSNYPGLTLRATITSIICGGWKVLGEKKTHCINAWDFARWDRDVNDDFSIVCAIYKILYKADAVITHNGKRFDWKFLQTRLIKHGLEPLSKIHHIDTCQVAKQNLFCFNNRLNTIGSVTNSGEKMTHEGWDLWVKVHGKDPMAMLTMSTYCKQDVDLLEAVYLKLRPLISGIPNYNLFTDSKVCPNCGSRRLQANGFRITKTVKYKRLRCGDCGTTSRTDTKELNPRTF